MMIDDIKAALTHEWQGSRQIWTRVGMWSVTGTRERLAMLVASGEAERFGIPGNYSYRLPSSSGEKSNG